jgi:hypothetical protein
VALEPFKRAHRYVDVLKANEQRRAEALRNERRELLKDQAGAFDPDVSKVVVVGGADAQDVLGGVIDDDEEPEDDQ